MEMGEYKSDNHRRRSIRLKGYDYSRAGIYFITLCTQERLSFFGDIRDGEMRRNSSGAMVQTVWDEIPLFYPFIGIDAFILMPNHIHGLITIDKSDEPGPALSLPDVVHRFKTMTTKRYADGVKQNGWPPFPGKLWQRNYWERIIRDDTELNNIPEYIQYNVKNWITDTLYMSPAL